MASAEVWPSPVFEGSEKRLEVDFFHEAGRGLRSLSRSQLDQLLESAGCCIVSDRHVQEFDAYVLSESSLFVFPNKLVLKTCGTTKILHAIPLLLELAASTGCSPKRCKYSRASFLFPHHQVHCCLYRSLVLKSTIVPGLLFLAGSGLNRCLAPRMTANFALECC